ncbi:Actin-3 [Dissostichus eleginoides]|uniref:Actin-3 n=1 Tax=Dissostichus eleginoides TaxID=100907 RepID=A0AAD9BUG2_DISEL|nr:Actin-3 [Dissostichus eleginoides]
MSRHATGAFDQHGCPLIVFPLEEQAKLSSELSKAEVVDFINYFLSLHNRKQEKEGLVSVVADLRHASLQTSRFIAETLLLLELHKRTVHSVYIIQPKKKDVVKLLLKLLAPSKCYTASFKKVLLKEISELSNYIDRSQLTPSLGGYLMYCHQSWVAFIKQLPSCISTLQALSRLPLPSTSRELQHFCSTNKATFLQLRRELGLDEVLRHCEGIVEKLRHPEKEPCYQAMAGTALFSHTAFDMLRNHSRICAAVEKVEQLWQQAFSKARLQLQVFQLREDALQITEQIKTLLQEKLQPYKIEIAKEAAEAVLLVSRFEASIHRPAMALVHCAEDVIHTVEEVLLLDGQIRERWVMDVERLKDKLHSAVHFILQTLTVVSSYHHHYSKASSWYRLVLSENFLQALLSGANGDSGSMQRRNYGTIPAWRYKMSTFLKKNPPSDVEELVHLAHLSLAIPDDDVQQAGKKMSQRCMILRKLLMSSGPVAVGPLQRALQWQYELLGNSQFDPPPPDDGASNRTAKEVQDLTNGVKEQKAAHLPQTVSASAEGKAPSLSSFDSGFDGAGGCQLEAWRGREGVESLCTSAGIRDSVRLASSQPQIHEENISSVSDAEDLREEFGSLGNSSRASIHIIPNVTVDSLNLEIKVKRSAALPSNPWLSLPVDNLENSYTVTITQNPTPHKGDLQLDGSDPCRFRDQPTQTDVLSRTQPTDWALHSQSSLEDPELSPIRKVLSSTITEGRERSILTTEGGPTLLWDSYDLHEQVQDAVDGVMDISLNDWEVKEQEGLREVEQILVRADEMLEKEENVLAQEAVLEALLRAEDRDQWPLWDSESQLSAMSSSELAEAGVLGLQDDLDPAESDQLSEPTSAGSAGGAQASEDEGLHTDTEVFHSRPDLLTELRKVHILDELIMEENMKIHKLRSCIESPEESASKPSITNEANKEREAFRVQLEKEKREVEKLEKSLDNEQRVKKHRDGAKKVVKCSIMEKARSETKEDKALCDELLSGGCNGSLRTHPTASVQTDPQGQDSCEAEHILLDPDAAKEATPQDLVQLPDSECQEDSPEAEPSEEYPPILPCLSQGKLPFLCTTTSNMNPPTPQSCRIQSGPLLIKILVLCNTGLQPAEAAQALSPAAAPSAPQLPPALPPDLPPEVEPGGRADFLDAVQSSEAMRGPGSGIQAQLNINMTQMTDFKTPIDLQINLPNIIFPTIIGMPKYEEIMNGNLERETYIGHEAQLMRGVLALRHPIKNGIIRNWDDMEKIWQHTFQQLGVDPNDHPVLLTEAAMNPLGNRQRMVEIMFECFNVPFTYVALQAVLALYAAGRSTGVVFDSGDGVSHSVPVFEGYCLPHAVQRFPLAGVDVTMHLKKLLQEQGVSMRTSAEMEIVREMKEKCCCVALNYEAELSQGGTSSGEMHYNMPDGQIVTLSSERFRAPEILFKPELIGQDHYGMHESVFKSILSSDIDLRRSFLGNIVLSGGNTLLPGLPERLQAEIKGLVPTDTGESVRVTSPKDRDFSVWSGGAVLANLPIFSSAWISQEEYDEHGSQIVFRKCF